MSLIDYSNSVIYQVVPKNKELEYRYIGGTTNFKMRKYQHKSDCKSENNKNHDFKVYKTIREYAMGLMSGIWRSFMNYKIVQIKEHST